ncbi:FKBP-type peptidyl-prolyl cis-trans isomerase [Actinomycetes bacterium KLBMP 9797]
MTTNQRPTKTERRAAAKAAAAQAAQRKRRNQAIAGALAGLAVFAVIFAGFFLLQGDDDADGASSPALTTTPVAPTGEPTGEPTAAPPTAQAAGQFPPVPKGADPALGEKPKVTAGQGELTKLTVTPIIQGKGEAAAAGKTIVVNYVGVSYQTGQEFDASWNRQEPFSFPLGGGQVIPGWDQGLVGVKVGSRVQLDIPANLAYGDNAGNGAPSGPLRFVVDVLALQ